MTTTRISNNRIVKNTFILQAALQEIAWRQIKIVQNALLSNGS